MTTFRTLAERPEIAAFKAALSRVLPQHEGKYGVIIGDRLVDRYFADYEEALTWAYETYGLDNFFIKKLTAAENATVHFTRDLGPCHN